MPFDGNEWDAKNFVSYMEVMDRLKKEKVFISLHISLALKNLCNDGIGNRIGAQSAVGSFPR